MATRFMSGVSVRNAVFVLCTAALLVLSLVSVLLAASPPSVTVTKPELNQVGQWKPLEQLPLKRNIIGDYRVRVSLNPGDKTALDLHVIPDDRLQSLKVNGRNIDLAGYDPGKLSDWNNGVVINLSELAPNRENLVEFGLTNASNPAGLAVKAYHRFGIADFASVAVGLGLLVLALLRHIRLAPLQVGVLWTGIAVSLAYFLVTDSHTRTFDVYEGGGHRDYVNYLIEERAVPLPGDGWEYHQPPLYYAIAAVAKALVIGADVDSERWAQLLALWFWVIFLVASLSAIRLPLRGERVVLFIASLAICLWPSGIIHSIRMGNDVPLYAFYALSFLYVLKWWGSNRHSHLLWACLWACLALLTKSNALAIWAVLGSLVLVRVLRSSFTARHAMLQVRRTHVALASVGLFFVLAMAANLGDNVWYYVTGQSNDWLLSNVSDMINPGLQVANAPANYLLMDVVTFVKYPFISSWDDEFGRQYFWNYVWRSALSSEFSFSGLPMSVWGALNGLLLLLMLASIVLLIGQLALPKQNKLLLIYRYLPWILASVFPFLLLLAYRIKVPLSCNTDFRYIYPVLIPLVLASLHTLRSSGNTAYKFMSVGAPLIGLATLAWIPILMIY